MPPEQTLIPASRTAEMVPSRSSYDRVVITWQKKNQKPKTAGGRVCGQRLRGAGREKDNAANLGVVLARGVQVVVVCGQAPV